MDNSDQPSGSNWENQPSQPIDFFEKSRDQMQNFFPSWETSGKLYMVPPAPIVSFEGPIDEKTSGLHKKIPILSTDFAETKVHSFLAKSQQHAFVLQNFTNVHWKRLLSFRGYDASDKRLEMIRELESIEIDFLILHAYAGIIVIECKSVKEFQVRRYSDSKKQLNKIVKFLNEFTKILRTTTSNTQYNIFPVRKVVCFPFVEMNPNMKDPYNLGRNDFNDSPEMWWERLLATEENKPQNVNLFETDHFYSNLVTFLLGMYSADKSSFGRKIKQIQEQIENQSFL